LLEKNLDKIDWWDWCGLSQNPSIFECEGIEYVLK